MSLLELTRVTKGYGMAPQRTEVLDDINLSVEENEFVAIVGYSGSGKTTLVGLMSGLQRPDAGCVRLRGKLLEEPGPDCAIVFQNYSLLPWLSVHGNIALAVDEVFKERPADERRRQVDKYIQMVNLAHAKDRKPRELSGGMRQRVSVARALAMEPEILLLDEPLSALDALTRATLQDEIARISRQERKTMVLITNDVQEAILLADRIIPLSAGPKATLGPSVAVDLPRPRDRKTIHHHPRYKEIQRQLLDYLMGPGARRAASIIPVPDLPDLEPEDLSLAPTLFGATRRRARRRALQSEREKAAA